VLFATKIFIFSVSNGRVKGGWAVQISLPFPKLRESYNAAQDLAFSLPLPFSLPTYFLSSSSSSSFSLSQSLSMLEKWHWEKMNYQEKKARREIFHKSSNETISLSLYSQLLEENWKNDLFELKKKKKKEKLHLKTRILREKKSSN